MSKKRLNPELAEQVFASMSSKHDLYKHLDQHLQVSFPPFFPNSIVLCMPVHDVHQRLRQGDLRWEEAAHPEEARVDDHCAEVWWALRQEPLQEVDCPVNMEKYFPSVYLKER